MTAEFPTVAGCVKPALSVPGAHLTFPGPGRLPSPGKMCPGIFGAQIGEARQPWASEVGSGLSWQPDGPLRANHTQLSSRLNPEAQATHL